MRYRVGLGAPPKVLVGQLVVSIVEIVDASTNATVFRALASPGRIGEAVLYLLQKIPLGEARGGRPEVHIELSLDEPVLEAMREAAARFGVELRHDGFPNEPPAAP